VNATGFLLQRKGKRQAQIAMVLGRAIGAWPNTIEVATSRETMQRLTDGIKALVPTVKHRGYYLSGIWNDCNFKIRLRLF